MQNRKILPRLRRDLQLSLSNQEGMSFILMKDPLGIASEPIAIHYNFYLILNVLDSGVTIEEFTSIVSDLKGFSDEIGLILEQIHKLDNLYFLESVDFLLKKYEFEQEYLNQANRKMYCSGSSYPENKEEFLEFCESFFSFSNIEIKQKNAKAIIAPHIDFNLGELSQSVYANCYNSIEDTEFDTIVIFGTSHYAFSDYFMFTKKHFETPLGLVETDVDLLNEMDKYFENKITYDDLAHRPEHSIEYQVVLSKFKFQNRKFKILPILVGSYYDFIKNSSKPLQHNKISELVEKLDKFIKSSGRNPIYIASVDFSHIGRKFDDDFDAETMLETVFQKDKVLIDAIIDLNPDKFFECIADENDKWKVCGTSPIYTLMNTVNFNNIKLLDYKQWNESETKSAVTFAGFALY